MNENRQFDGSSRADNSYAALARWLHHTLNTTTGNAFSEEKTEEGETWSPGNYHPRYYQQLPDFIAALLKGEARVLMHYSPLLYHLGGCSSCMAAFVELYDALGYAMYTEEEHLSLYQSTRSLASMPPSTLVHFCQTLIHQAEALLRMARHSHNDQTGEFYAQDAQAAARVLLRLAMRISAQLTQGSSRVKALHNLVRVANLAEGVQSSVESESVRAYEPLIGSGSARHGTVMRKANTLVRSADTPLEQPAIILQSHLLEGSIVQNKDVLELHLQELDQHLRQQYVTISVPLGSLLEPVRWIGGNPRAIRSAQPVSSDGSLVTPLGHTTLQLSNLDERNLLEVIFLLLEVRPAA